MPTTQGKVSELREQKYDSAFSILRITIDVQARGSTGLWTVSKVVVPGKITLEQV
jgi:hypothetical protein